MNADNELATLRAQLDALDAELLPLLNRRASLSLRVGDLKKRHGLPIRRPEREAAILEALAARNNGPLTEKHLLAIYSVIFAVSRELQEEGTRSEAK